MACVCVWGWGGVMPLAVHLNNKNAFVGDRSMRGMTVHGLRYFSFIFNNERYMYLYKPHEPSKHCINCLYLHLFINQ